MIRHLFTSRREGNLAGYVGEDPEEVRYNRSRLGVDPHRIVWMNQTHSTFVRKISGPRAHPVADTDGIVTDRAGLVLAVLVADCVPVLLGDATHGVVAAVHAGRAGAAGGVVVNALRAMGELGARPETTSAWLGPAAGGKNYEVPVEMAIAVDRVLPSSRTRTRWGSSGLDLRAGIARQLRGALVGKISVSEEETIGDRGYFSYRREGETGRQAGLIWMEGE